MDGTQFTVKGKEGDNLLDIAVNNDLDLDGFGECKTDQGVQKFCYLGIDFICCGTYPLICP